MLDYVTPILNDRAKYYADLLTHGEMSVSFSTKTALKSGQEKDKFTITCQQAHGATSYRGASAGERARADLVIAMALGDLAQFRTAKQLPWRFLDEPFESIDRSGTEAIVRLLNDQKARYNTVFVVTHKPDFKELFSQQVTVVKENGVSSLLEE
jgi:DNA repair exonuclease SbcCD ATPase subunit